MAASPHLGGHAAELKRSGPWCDRWAVSRSSSEAAWRPASVAGRQGLGQREHAVRLTRRESPLERHARDNSGCGARVARVAAR
jgi:hypothetical protein